MILNKTEYNAKKNYFIRQLNKAAEKNNYSDMRKYKRTLQVIKMAEPIKEIWAKI